LLAVKVLVACEYSGVVRDAFIRRGHDAMSCDILPSERPGPHYEGDVTSLLTEPFDLVIAHPPCTYLSNSGSKHLYQLNERGGTVKDENGRLIPNKQRWLDMEEGAEFFRTMSLFNAPRIAIENPLQHRHAVAVHGLGRQNQTIQPWMFGHPESKATGLWLFNLPPLEPTDDVEWHMELLPKTQQQRIFNLPPTEDRGKIRSATFPGIADAMAEQWGCL
jgi:hypothetical protein